VEISQSTRLALCAPALYNAQAAAGRPMNHKRRHNMRRALDRLDWHISNVVDGMQRDMAKWLCTRFDLGRLVMVETILRHLHIKSQEPTGKSWSCGGDDCCDDCCGDCCFTNIFFCC